MPRKVYYEGLLWHEVVLVFVCNKENMVGTSWGCFLFSNAARTVAH